MIDRYTCEEVFRRLDLFLDRELSPEEARLVEEHLRVCEACLAHHRFEAAVLEAVRGRIRLLDPPPGLVDRLARLLDEEERGMG